MIINRLDFLQRAQIDQQTLEVWLREEWLLPGEVVSDLEFSDIDLARATLIVDLKKQLGVNDEGVDVILHLIDQVHGLRRLVGGLLAEEPGAPPSET